MKNNDLLKDVFLEFLYGKPLSIEKSLILTENREFLFESYGLLPNLSEYCCRFFLYLKKEIKEHKANFIIKDNIFEDIPNVFFEKVYIKVDFQEDSSIICNSNGGYQLHANNFDNESKKLKMLHIVLKIRCNSFNIERACFSIFGHELTHAYEDFQRDNKGSKTSFADSIINSGYTKINRASVNNIEKLISNIYYLLNSTERKAYKATFYGQLLAKKDEIDDTKTATSIIKSTAFYKRFENIQEKINELEQIGEQSEENRKEIVNHYNYIFSKQYSTLNHVIKNLNYYFSKYWNKFRIDAAKIAADIYSKNKITIY